MRACLLFLTALGACTAPRVSAPPPSTCRVLQATGPATYAAADTTAAYAAVQDFARYVGAPYALLYLSTTGGHPEKDRCLRLVQRGPDRFTAYAYRRAGRVDSTAFASPSLARQLAAPAGHFATLCPGMSGTYHETLWVKHGPATKCSLAGEWSDLRAPLPPGPAFALLVRKMEEEGPGGLRFVPPADSALLHPALDLLRVVQRLKY